MIFNIQRYSIHDGDGIRTLIFYKGCPLRCRWCSNPEGLTFGYSVLYDRRGCRGFGDCLEAGGRAISRNGQDRIKIRRELLKDPGSLTGICPSKALSIAGEKKSVDELLVEIEKDIPFYREDGGVTLSGGEPLSQGEDLVELLKELKERNIKANIETSLHVDWERIERCIGLVDTFLVDLKHTEWPKFNEFTGGDLTIVLDNLRRLVLCDVKTIIRIPVIPGFNHSEIEMKKMIDLVDSLSVIKELHFLPYHTMGTEKYRMLEMDYTCRDFAPVNAGEIEPYLLYAASRGLESKIGG